MDFNLPELEKHMVVTTPYQTIPNITANKKYIILGVDRNLVLLRNDVGAECLYSGLDFIEAEIFFALSMYMTFTRILGLANLPLKSLDK